MCYTYIVVGNKNGSSYWKILPTLALCFFLPGFQVFGQDRVGEREELWVSPGAEIVFYSPSFVAYGGGLALGYGRGAVIGLKVDYFVDTDNMISTLELNFLFRWYFFGVASCSGPYIQLNGGPAVFTKDGSFAIPSEWGSVSAGLSLGWRFLLGRYWFIEGALRGGYPYIVGAGLSFGLHI